MSDQAKKKFYKKWWFWVAAFIVLIIIISSLGGSKPAEKAATVQPKQEEVQAIAITAPKLAQAYIDNEVNADSLYKGKLLKISGMIKDIGKDILDTPYVTLETNPSDYITEIQCMFGKGDLAQLAQLKKGSQITVEGNGSGKLMNVLVRNCEIINE